MTVLIISLVVLITCFFVLFYFRLTRWYLFTRYFLKWFRKQSPAISHSERDFLESGGTWFEKQFFLGNPDWQQLFQLKAPQLTDEEQHFLDCQTEILCQLINNWEIEQAQDLPQSIWDYIKKEGFWGLIIEKKYGGHGFSALAHSAIVTKIASRSISVAITVMVPNSLGPGEFLTHFGTEQQKTYFLPRLASGEEIGCFALTGLTAGSDAASISDIGVACYGDFQGEMVLGIRLNWDKRYITLAPIATLIAVVFKLSDPDHLLGNKENMGMTVALIPKTLPGVESGARHCPLHLAFLNGPVRGREVFIPLDFVMGGREACGHGWKMMMECLALGRGISLPSLATGSALLSFRMTGAYAKLRHQFKRPIGDFEGVAQVLGEMGGLTYLCEATRLFTAMGVDAGARPAIAAAITKYHLTELSRRIVNHAMDIHAGRGIQLGPRNYLGYLYQALPIGITVEGANILTRSLIIFGQGALRCHPYLRDELIALEKSDYNQFDRLLISHIKFIFLNGWRAVINSICISNKKRLTYYLRQLTRMSAAFCFIADITMGLLGKNLKLKEILSARLADILSHLYLSAAVIKMYHDGGESEEEWLFAQWSLDYCLSQIQLAWDAFFLNYPVRMVGKLLKWKIFPWGRAYLPPKDIQTQQIAVFMQQPSLLRDRLTRYCYIGNLERDLSLEVDEFTGKGKFEN